jgi:hypothetical protein
MLNTKLEKFEVVNSLAGTEKKYLKIQFRLEKTILRIQCPLENSLNRPYGFCIESSNLEVLDLEIFKQLQKIAKAVSSLAISNQVYFVGYVRLEKNKIKWQVECPNLHLVESGIVMLPFIRGATEKTAYASFNTSSLAIKGLSEVITNVLGK